MTHLSLQRKIQLARIVGLSPVRHLMGLAIKMTVPKHRTGVAIVGFNPEGQILLLRHVFHPTVPWGLPGGWLEKGEAPADCAVRELHEETGLNANLGPIIYSSFETTPAHIGIAFIATIQPKKLSLSGEIIEADWFEPASLPETLLPFVQNAIRAANDSSEQLNFAGRDLYE